jgi:hypothetical protein
MEALGLLFHERSCGLEQDKCVRHVRHEPQKLIWTTHVFPEPVASRVPHVRLPSVNPQPLAAVGARLTWPLEPKGHRQRAKETTGTPRHCLADLTVVACAYDRAPDGLLQENVLLPNLAARAGITLSSMQDRAVLSATYCS